MHFFNWKICLIAILSFGYGTVLATPGTVKGQVQYIRSHDATQYPIWASPLYWFVLKGVSVAGTYPTWNGGVLFVANDKQELALVLSAQLSAQEIEADFDDAVLTNGFCRVRSLTIGNPAPVN